jgi:hypothetical protein
MFSDKGFADGANADPFSGSAAVATAANVTAVIIADKKPVVNNSVLPTSDTEKLWKQDWIKGIVSELIADVWQNIPLWIKVPPGGFPQARSSLRCLRHRLSLLNAAKQHTKPE